MNQKQKKKTKRFLSLLLSLAMVFVMAAGAMTVYGETAAGQSGSAADAGAQPTSGAPAGEEPQNEPPDASANAAASVTIAGETVYYDDFNQAWTAAQGKTATVTLLRDVTLDDYPRITNAATDLTFEGGDHVLTVSGEKLYWGIWIKDGIFTLESGTIKVISSINVTGVGVSNSSLKANLYVHGGTIDVTNTSESGTATGLYLNTAAANITGGTIRAYGAHTNPSVGVKINNAKASANISGSAQIEAVGGKSAMGVWTVGGEANLSGSARILVNSEGPTGSEAYVTAGVQVSGGTANISGNVDVTASWNGTSSSGEICGVYVKGLSSSGSTFAGTANISGGTFTAKGKNSYGIRTTKTSVVNTAKLSGGTFTGDTGSVYVYGMGDTVGSLLDTTREETFYYYQGEAVDLEYLITEPTVLNSTRGLYAASGYGTVTVAPLAPKSSDTGVKEVRVEGTAGVVEGKNITVTLPAATQALPTDSDQISIILSDSKAAVSGLSTGDGGETWTFTVTAEDGTTAEYTIHVTIVQPVIEVQNDGNGTASASASCAAPGTEIILTAEPENGYCFKEWQVVSGGITVRDSRFIMPAQDVIVKAVFEPQTYAVILEPNGGVINSGAVSSYTFGSGACLPADVVKSGSAFAGWYDNPDFSGDPVTEIKAADTGDKTYYAKWETKGTTEDPSKPVNPTTPVTPADPQPLPSDDPLEAPDDSDNPATADPQPLPSDDPLEAPDESDNPAVADPQKPLPVDEHLADEAEVQEGAAAEQPGTGDETPLMALTIMLLVSAGALGAVSIRRKSDK